MTFNDPNKALLARSILTATSGKRIYVNGPDAPNGIAFYTGDAAETFPGVIQPDSSLDDLSITQASPLVAGHAGSSLALSTGKGASADSAQLGSQNLLLSGSQNASLTGPIIGATGINSAYYLNTDGTGQYADVIAPRIFLRDNSSGANDNGLIASGKLLDVINNRWFTKADTALTGTWVDTAGARFGYYKDAVGNVHLRGLVSGGGAGATIITLPAGYRPSSNLNFTMAIAGGVTICSVGVSTTGAVTVATNLAAASASGIYLDVVNYQTA